MTMAQEEFSARFKGGPIKRARRRGLLRNMAVVPGNRGSSQAVPALAVALNDEEPLVRISRCTGRRYPLARLVREPGAQTALARGEPG
jgi:hypothetical protein